MSHGHVCVLLTQDLPVHVRSAASQVSPESRLDERQGDHIRLPLHCVGGSGFYSLRGGSEEKDGPKGKEILFSKQS